MTRITEWHGCYDSSMKDLITPESFAHPAKMARGLCERIFDYGHEKGYWDRGDTIIDPFGGISTTGILGAYRGYQVISVELEERFVAMGQDNIAINGAKLERLGSPLPVHVQGDSRFLLDILIGADGGISSPPFLQSKGGTPEPKEGGTIDGALYERHAAGNSAAEGYGQETGQIGNMDEGDFAGAISSPPYSHQQSGGGISKALNGQGDYPLHDSIRATDYRKNQGYQNQGENPDNLDELPEGDHTEIIGGISSPPYSEARIGQSSGEAQVGHGENYGATPGQLGSMPEGEWTGDSTSPPYDDMRVTGNRQFRSKDQPDRPSAKDIREAGYGGSEGQIGAITSPHKEDSVNSKRHGIDLNKLTPDYPGRVFDNHRKTEINQRHSDFNYGTSTGQIGSEKGDTYWAAVAAIYTQVYELLPPGGAFAVVVKDFVRNWERVPLCDQTAELLQAIGFEIPERIHAMLVKDIPQPIDMFTGEATPLRKERKSFFRRLAEKKGAPPINYEEVIWAVKP